MRSHSAPAPPFEQDGATTRKARLSREAFCARPAISASNCRRPSRSPSHEYRFRRYSPGTHCNRTSHCTRRRRGSRRCTQRGAACRRPSHRFVRKPAFRRSHRTPRLARDTAGSRIHRIARRSRRYHPKSRRCRLNHPFRRHRCRRRLRSNPSRSRHRHSRSVQRAHILRRSPVHNGLETVIFSHAFSCAPLWSVGKARIAPKRPKRTQSHEI